MKKLLIIAGGTGGHIFPALAVADALQQAGVVIEWMGTTVGMEKKLVGDRYPMHFLPVKGLRGKGGFEKILAPFRIIRAVFLAYFVIKKINPDVVLGMGGYASGPGGIATWLLRKPLVIHEQNAIAGMTNKILSHFAKTVLQAFPTAFPAKIKAMTVGNPVRNTIKKTNDVVHQPLRILILGGSQGSQFMNQLMMDFVANADFRKDFLLWHQTGLRDFESVKTAYSAYEDFPHRVSPFIEKMDEAYAWADSVIARSGALTVSEIATAGLPSILIPFPQAVDDHQYANASFLKQAGAALVFRESDMDAKKLSVCLKDLISSPQQLAQMANCATKCARPNAVLDIVKCLGDRGLGIGNQ